MDTRGKIIDVAEASRLADGGATVVSGYFDPLVAWHAERLGALERDATLLLVVIASPRHPILPARARAELVASLRVVDYVTEADLTPQIQAGPKKTLPVFKDLVERVHARQDASS